MTRRRVVFVRKDGRRYITEEFNGDKEDYEFRAKLFGGSLDGCDATWDEIIRTDWAKAVSYRDFVKANVAAFAHYHSFLDRNGGAVPVVRNLPQNRDYPAADEILIIHEAAMRGPFEKTMTVLKRDDDGNPVKITFAIS